MRLDHSAAGTGRLDAIWIKRVRRGPMDSASAADLVENRGIAGNANQGGRRQVTIIEHEIWEELMHELKAEVAPSIRRANLMVSGVSLRNSRGAILEIGDTQIEIVGETKPCERMEESLPGLRAAMYADWKGGAFGVILRGGTIRVGDAVRLRAKTDR